MAFPDDFMRELRSRNDIVSTVSSYVRLRQRGRVMVGLCPFHSDKSPSFTVYPDTDSFYCFGCQAGGDVVKFISLIENLDYIDTIKLLASRSGLQMPENRYDPDDGMRKLKLLIYEINREAARKYYETLYGADGREGLDYLREKRALDDVTIRKFGLGFAPNKRSELTDYLMNKGYKLSDLVTANLTVQGREGPYDRFRNRIMFPIIDVMGNVIAFGGRIMTDEKPKYLNTSDTPAYKKTNNLYSLNLARHTKSDKLILCEGYMDVIALYRAGFDNAVGGLGTALTEEQVRLLRRYRKDVVLCYDSDEAGQKAAVRAMQLCDKQGVNTRVIKVPDGKDPDEYIKRHGSNGYIKFKALVEGSSNDVEYFFDTLRDKYDTSTLDGKFSALDEAAKFLAAVTNPVKRDLYTGKICDEMGVKRESLEPLIQTELRHIDRREESAEKRRLRENLTGQSGSGQDSAYKAKTPRAGKAEEMLTALLIAHPEMAGTVSSKLSAENFTVPLTRKLFTEITERIKSGRSAGLTELSEGLSSDENSHIAGMIARFYDAAGASAAPALCDEYVNVILEENTRRSSEELSKESDEEIAAYLKSLKASKHRKHS